MKKLFVMFLFLSVFAHAATVKLKNGDTITGAILKSDGRTVVIKTESAGDVTIALDAVTELEGSGNVYVLTKDGRTLKGEATMSGGTWSVATADAGAVQVPAAEMTALYDESTYAAEVGKFLKPGWGQLWAGFAEVGLSLARGNSDTSNLAIGANATRTTKKDKTSFYFASLYATNNVLGDSVTTANLLRGGGRYERNVSDHLFGFGFSDLEHDELQQLNLRWVMGGGIGWYLVRNDLRQFQFFGGVSYNREDFEGQEIRNSAEALAGEEFDQKVSDRCTFMERFVIFPNLSESGEYRMNFDAGLQTKINKWLGWQITLSDRYLSNPIEGSEKNDLILTTGARFTFGS